MGDDTLLAFFTARLQPGPDQQPQLIFCNKYATETAQPHLPPDENLLPFAFPLSTAPLLSNTREKHNHSSTYDFTLTTGDGTRLHGYARQSVVFENNTGVDAKRQQQVAQTHCIISRLLWPFFFHKVLELLEVSLNLEPTSTTASSPPHQQVSPDSPAGLVLTQLQLELQSLQTSPSNNNNNNTANNNNNDLSPGSIITLQHPQLPPTTTIPPMLRALPSLHLTPATLRSTPTLLDLEIPPDLGLGRTTAVATASLLWYTTPRQILTLFASLLLERRVILVSEDLGRVSAATHAAAALLWPLEWQHVYLPLLPTSLKDYVGAPMPLLIGLPAQILPLVDREALHGAIVFDLDRPGRCSPALGSSKDDALLLPSSEKLLKAFDQVFESLQGPDDMRATPVVAEIVCKYLCGVLGRYRQFVGRDWGSGLHTSTSSSGSGSSGGGSQNNDCIRAYGYMYNHAAYITAVKKRSTTNTRLALFLDAFRHSQLFEVFMNRRLELTSLGPEAAAAVNDPFENALDAWLSSRPSAVVADKLSQSKVKLGQFVKRTSSGIAQRLQQSGENGSRHRRSASAGGGIGGGGGGGSEVVLQAEHVTVTVTGFESSRNYQQQPTTPRPELNNTSENEAPLLPLIDFDSPPDTRNNQQHSPPPSSPSLGPASRSQQQQQQPMIDLLSGNADWDTYDDFLTPLGSALIGLDVGSDASTSSYDQYKLIKNQRPAVPPGPGPLQSGVLRRKSQEESRSDTSIVGSSRGMTAYEEFLVNAGLFSSSSQEQQQQQQGEHVVEQQRVPVVDDVEGGGEGNERREGWSTVPTTLTLQGPVLDWL